MRCALRQVKVCDSRLQAPKPQRFSWSFPCIRVRIRIESLKPFRRQWWYVDVVPGMRWPDCGMPAAVPPFAVPAFPDPELWAAMRASAARMLAG